MGTRGHAGGFVLDRGVIVPEKSSASCALASQGDWLCLAWTGTDTRLNTIWSQDGRHFTGKQRLDHRSYRTETTSTSANVSTSGSSSSTTQTVCLSPGLAWASTGTCLAWTGTDRRLNLWNLHGGPSAHIILPEKSAYAPRVAATGPQISVAWTGTDRRLNLAYGTHGGATTAASFGPAAQIDVATSSHSPAVCHLHRDGTAPPGIALAWTGTDRRLNVSVARGGPFSPPITLDDTSHSGPALCAFGQDLMLAWQGTDRRLNVASWPVAHIVQLGHAGQAGPGAARRATLAATSSHQPVLAEYRSQLLIAWTGTDMRPNLARLSPM